MKPLSNPIWNLLVFLAGLFFTLAFAPFNYAYLTMLALVILFSSWVNATPKQAAWRGFLFGLGAFGLGVTWVFVSIFFYGKAQIFISLLLAALFAAFWALFPALTAYISVKLSKVIHKNLLFFVPFVWIFIEYFRGYWLLNGFPWLQVSYSQLDTAYAGFIPVIGGYGSGFLIVTTAALFTYLIHFKQKMFWVSGAISTLLIAGYGLKQISWTEQIPDPIKITLVQGNISQDKKWQPENFIHTLLTYQQMTYSHWDSDVIIWPETAIPAFLNQVDEDFIRPLAIEAVKNNTDLIVSLPSQSPDFKKTFNSVLTLGSSVGVYHKNHLLPFGEYLPLQPISGWILDLVGIRLGSFTAGGSQQALLSAGGYPFATSICYEDAFSEEVLNKLPEAAYLVNVTNDAWFGKSLEPHQHMQIARMRALESGRYLMRATNTGVTGFVAPNGKIIKQAPLFQPIAISETIFPMKGMTPYAYLGDKVIVFILGVLLVLILSWDYLKPKKNPS